MAPSPNSIGVLSLIDPLSRVAMRYIVTISNGREIATLVALKIFFTRAVSVVANMW